MRHRTFGRKIGRTKDERRALFRNLVGELIVHGRVKTSIAKAKAVKPLIDKLVTKAKASNLAGQRHVLSMLPKESGLALVNSVVPQFKNRTSGFSRIIKLGERRGDSTEVVILEWTDQVTALVPVESKVSRKPATTENTEGKTEDTKKKSVKSVVARKRSKKQPNKKVAKRKK